MKDEYKEMVCRVRFIDGVLARTYLSDIEIVRCKNCKHRYYHELLKQDYCEIPNMQFGEIDPNGYCHRAERREE